MATTSRNALLERLKKNQAAFKKSRKNVGDSTGGFELVEPGTYEASIDSIKLEAVRNKPLQVVMFLKILDSDEKDKTIRHSWNLDNEVGNDLFIQFLNLLGYIDVEDIEMLPEIIEEIDALNVTLEIFVKIKDNYNRVNFNSVLEQDGIPGPNDTQKDAEEEEDAEEEDAEMDDDLDGLNKAALRSIIEEEELDVKITRNMTAADVALEITAARRAVENENEEEEGEEEEVDFKSMDLSELKAYIKENSLGIRVTAKMKKQEVISKILEKLEEGEEEENSEDEQLTALKELCDAFGIDVEAYDNLKDLKAYLKKKHKGDFEDLEEDEEELLNNLGLSTLIA